MQKPKFLPRHRLLQEQKTTRTASSCENRLRKGFTLIEMLVVIAIIALLAAILVPTVNNALKSAKRSSCASNLRQVGQAIMIFATNNKGYIPPVNDGGSLGASGGQFWMEAISPYLGEETENIMADDIAAITHACPSWEGRKDVNEIGRATKPGYGMNDYPLRTSSTLGDRNVDPKTVSLDQIKSPTTTILVGDSVDYHLSTYAGNNWSTTSSNPYGYNSGHPDRHGKKANYLMADGSVTALDPDEALARLVDPTSN